MMFTQTEYTNNYKILYVYITYFYITGLHIEMLRLWEELCPLHQIDYCMDDVYMEIGKEV